MSLFNELKRRNVFRVAAAYAVVAWLVLQLLDVVAPLLDLPEWISKFFLLIILAGFPFAIIFAWVFEVTPEGIKRDEDVDRDETAAPARRHKLDRVIIAVLVLAVGFLLVDKFLLQQADLDSGTDTGGSGQSLTIAVLPFVNISGDKENEYFADGLSEELLNKLAQVPGLQVTGRTSSFAYKGRDEDLRVIGETLGVANLLEGSVRRQSDQVRVTAQLIRASDGFHLWSDTYDRTLDDVFAIQDEIAESVTAALDIVLDERARQQMLNYGVRDVDAFIAYQKGVEAFTRAHGTGEMIPELQRADPYFAEVIRLSPNFADAYYLRSDVFSHIALDARRSDEERNEAIAAFRANLDKAYEFANNPLQKVFVDIDRTFFSDDWSDMPNKFDRVAAADTCARPNWSLLAMIFGYQEKVLSTYERQIECDPLFMLAYLDVAFNALWTGDFEKALLASEAGNKAVGSHPWLHFTRAMSLAALQRHDETIAAAGRTDADSSFYFNHATVAALMVAGRVDEARDAADAWFQRHGSDSNQALPVYSTLGDRESANALAADIDSQPGGPVELALAVAVCFCGAPFDIGVTPNFKERIEEADAPWPPPSPLTIAAKDW